MGFNLQLSTCNFQLSTLSPKNVFEAAVSND